MRRGPVLKCGAVLASLIVLAFGAADAQDAQQGQLVPLHPITQQQYEAILGLTDGQPVISEGRLIISGLAALTGLATGLTTGLTAALATSWVPSIVSNWLRHNTNHSKDEALQQAYPLCVVTTDDNDVEQEKENAHEEHEDGRAADEIDDSLERPLQLTASPKVSCIVVVREPEEAEEQKETDEPVRPQRPPLHSWYASSSPTPRAYYAAYRSQYYPWQYYYPYSYSPYAYYPYSPAYYAPPPRRRQQGSQRHRNRGRSAKHPRAHDSNSEGEPQRTPYKEADAVDAGNAYKKVHYPQNSYQSRYPQAAYSTALSQAAPIYVRTNVS